MFGPTLVEFLGTALIISAGAFGNSLLIIAALAISLTLGGKISGGYFNPAITFFKFLTGEIGQTKTMYYIVAQYSAAILVYFLSNV